MNNKRKEIIAVIGILCLLMFVSSFASLSFIAHNDSHVCRSSDCSICALLSSAEKILDLVLVVLFIRVFVGNVEKAAYQSGDNTYFSLKNTTPITLKVKLSD